jgi:short subunit dehydrogenase-like uncharacterized protein
MPDTFLLYGANGYTGKLIARFAAGYGLFPILAGRKEDAIRPLAEELKLPWRVFNLDNAEKIVSALREVKLVVHAAGPFSATAKQMIEACLEAGTHYIDINGDIAVFEMIKKYDAAARGKNIMLLPGAGFDVVPTDCLALYLKKKLPAATELKLAFATIGGGVSQGTALTIINKLGEGGAARSKGKIIKRPLGEKGRMVDFGERKLFAMTIPWGDISTAYSTTGIPDIEVYMGVKKKMFRMLKLQWLFNPLLRTGWIRKIARKKIRKRAPGPDDASRTKAKSLLWGQVKDQEGHALSTVYSCADGYTLTAYGSLIIVKKILDGNFKPGYQTPASCYGEGLVGEIPGTTAFIDR